jgi:hypothetical protein
VRRDGACPHQKSPGEFLLGESLWLGETTLPHSKARVPARRMVWGGMRAYAENTKVRLTWRDSWQVGGGRQHDHRHPP